jgi:glycosyltransferase involved in cell wall biosynthesis
MSTYPSVAFDDQIKRRQRLGGISRYFRDLEAGLLNCGLQVLPSNQAGRRRAQVIHSTFYGGRPYRVRSDQGLVSSLFDMTPERHPHFFPYRKLRSPHANKAAWLEASDLIISISAASADDCAFYLPKVQTPVSVIPLSTAMDDVTPRAVPTLVDRRFWLLVGKRRGYKNSITLFRALQRTRLNTQKNDWPILVCAGGEALDRSERHWLTTNSLAPWVRFLNAEDHELAWLYRHAEAVLVPSLAEGFSLPLIEALACNTPVVASDLEVHREVADSYATLLPALNSNLWAEALQAAANQPLQRPVQTLGSTGWKQVRNHYSPARLISDHISAYGSIKPT